MDKGHPSQNLNWVLSVWLTKDLTSLAGHKIVDISVQEDVISIYHPVTLVFLTPVIPFFNRGLFSFIFCCFYLFFKIYLIEV